MKQALFSEPLGRRRDRAPPRLVVPPVNYQTAGVGSTGDDRVDASGHGEYPRAKDQNHPMP